MAEHETYTLMDGKGIASERLTKLNESYNPHSLNLLQNIDLSGKTVLEVACGIGLFSCELSKLVGKNGKVVAIDISSNQLNVAKNTAKRQKCNNIEFIECSAYDLKKLNMKFDCIYCRFLLTHLDNPIKVIEQELACLNNEGYLICVEPNSGYSNMFCYPESDTFEKIKEIHFLQTKIHSTDFTIGKKLPYILQKYGTKLVYSHSYQATLNNSSEKKQLRLALCELSPQLIAKKIKSKSEVDKLLIDLEQWEQEKHSVGYVSCTDICVKV